MLSDHDRAFLREIGIASDPDYSVTLGGEDFTQHVSSVSVNWQGIPFLSVDSDPLERWFPGCVQFIVLPRRPDARD